MCIFEFVLKHSFKHMLDTKRLFIGWNWGGSWTLRVKRWKPSKDCLLHWLLHIVLLWGEQLQCLHWLGRKLKVRWVHISNPVIKAWTWIQSILHSRRAWCNSTGLVANTHSQHIDTLICQPLSWVHNYNVIQSEVFSHKELVFNSVTTRFRTVKAHHQELDWMTHLELFILH